MSYLIDDSKGVVLNKKFQKFGYRTNLVLINLGPQIQTLVFFLFLMLLFSGFSLNNKLKRKLQRILKMFKFNIFLRFWIQTFFESIIAGYISLKYSSLENSIQIIDYIAALLIFVNFK
jgi:hypothetical protein